MRIPATPDSSVSPAIGIFESLRSVGPLIASEERRADGGEPFDVEIVGESAGEIESVSGLSITAERSVDEVGETEIVIVPSMGLDGDGERVAGRYPKLVRWLREMYEGAPPSAPPARART